MAQGLGTLGGLGGETDPDRILKIFADDVESFPLMQMDIFGFVQAFNREGSPGNVQEVVYRNFGNGDPQELAEGEDPEMSHADLLSDTLTVKKYGERPAVTMEMIEDGRFDEMALALEHASQKMINGYVNRFFEALKAGPYGSTDIPQPFMNETWANAAAHRYSADHAGADILQSVAGHIYNTGAASLYEGDISLAIRHIEEHGFAPDTILIDLALMQELRDLVGFSKDMVTTDLPQELMRLGRPAGRIYGLDVVVVPGGRLDSKQFIVTSRAARPVAYLNKRGLRVDRHGEGEADQLGWDVRGVTLSARYGFKMLEGLKGSTVVATVST